MNLVKTILPLLLVLLSTVFSNPAYSVKPVYASSKERIAIRGYDAVAYFTQGSPIKGLDDYAFDYNGATWLFSSSDHLRLFKSAPEKYAPQYGGYCAYAISRETTASSKPQYFTIHDGKLYLNFSKDVNNKWLKDKDDYIKQADTNWPVLLNK